MAIDYRRLRRLTARQLTAALIRDGFFLRRQLPRTRRTERFTDASGGGEFFSKRLYALLQSCLEE